MLISISLLKGRLSSDLSLDFPSIVVDVEHCHSDGAHVIADVVDRVLE
jgi:hypothetical protein